MSKVMKQEESQVKRAFIIEIISDTRDKELARQKHEELLLLIETHGNIEVVDMFYQHIDPLYKTYIGSGKLQELREDMLNQNVDLLIIGNILKSAQVFNVNEYLRVGESGTEEESHLQAWDQIDLLLKIFDLHAQSSEAKLQIELAAIKHMGPRIFGMGMELSRQ
jgi:GTP-binding protein HflX